jgi:hypothetical protein
MIGQVLWLEFFGNRDWPVASALASCCCDPGDADHDYRQREARQLESERSMTARRTAELVNITALALGLAFLYLPIAILVINSFNDSRLVTMWGGWSLRWYRGSANDAAMLEPLGVVAHRVPLGDRRDRARHAGGARADARRALPRRAAVLRHDLRAAGDAGSDHRAVAAAAVRRASRSTAASGPSRSRTRR